MFSKHPRSPINQIRIAARKTGEELAAILNVSVGALRNMERGSQAVSDDFAERLFVAFGVAPASVKPKEGQAIYELTQVPYDRDCYLEWLRLTTLDDAKAKQVIDRQLKRLGYLLEAAALNGSLFTVDYQANRAIDKIATQGQLDGYIRSRLRQEGKGEAWYNLDSGSIGVIEYVLSRLDSLPPKPKADVP